MHRCNVFSWDIYHTIYKNHFVGIRWAVCGCVRVCNTSLKPSRPPYERMMEAIRFARAARPQCAKMWFLLHKTALEGRFKTWNIKISYMSCQKMSLLTGKQKDKWLYKIHIVSELTTNIGKGNKKLPKVSQKTLLVRVKWERSDHFASM